MTSTSKNVYIDKLDDIVSKYRNTYHRTIKMNPIDINPSMYFGFKKKMLLVVLKVKKFLKGFTKKSYKKQIKQRLELKK